MDITPNAGTIAVSITTWNTSGTYSKQWTETGTGVSSATHTVGNLEANTNYTVKADGSSSTITGANCTAGVCLSNASGNITFTHTGYSSHTFTIENPPPALTEITPVPTPACNTTPSYTFSTTEAGTISYTGDCSSATTTATAGNNTITFETLNQGTRSNCKLRVTDAAGSVSDWLTISTFSIACGGGGLPPQAYLPPTTPEGGFKVTINNNQETTNERTVTLALNGGENTIKMAISNTENFENAIQELYQTQKQWMLAPNNGKKTVYVKFYTNYGVVSQTVSDEIILTSQSETPQEPELKISKMTQQQIQEKITEIKQQLILLLTQVIQILMEQVAQMKG